MPHSARAFLLEMQRAVQYLLEQAKTQDLASYKANETLQFAVERNFITLGEAMSQLRRDFPSVADRIPKANQIAAFRNFVIHQYWDIDNNEVWSILITEVEPLRVVVERLLADPTLT